MDQTILGVKSDTFYAIIFVLLLVILGLVTFNYYVYVSGGDSAVFRAGTGVGFTLLPGRGGSGVHMEQERRQ